MSCCPILYVIILTVENTVKINTYYIAHFCIFKRGTTSSITKVCTLKKKAFMQKKGGLQTHFYYSLITSMSIIYMILKAEMD